MKLQTNIQFSKASNSLIDYNSKILLLGSCFVENIGGKLEYFKFQNYINPFGVLFHPNAIETLVSKSVNGAIYCEDDLFCTNEQWHCFDVHSKLSNTSKPALLKCINEQLDETNKQLNNATHIIITLGTAWVYRFIETNSIVANCHKVPQKQFNKELMTIESIVSSLTNILSLIRSVNSNAQVIFTVSPIRHLKDGFIENTQSKAHLVSAIHQFLNEKLSIENGSSFYFPSYEIMMDELRDYRFYNEDMIHPNKTAINYIWGKFKEVWLATDALKTMQDIESIQKGLQHKPFNPNSEAHKKFVESLNKKIEILQHNFPNITF